MGHGTDEEEKAKRKKRIIRIIMPPSPSSLEPLITYS
jgi:hypothetical protein